MQAIEELLNRIENDLRDNYDREVASIVIGEKVMEELRQLDEVAYVRFASVYKQFSDLNGFLSTIDQLKNK